MRLALALAALLIVASAGLARDNRPGEFDFYVLALSWSPSHCLTEGMRRGADERCTPPARGFVLHGLWPQWERGWPEFCAGVETRIPDTAFAPVRETMPSTGLARHQWRKHGTCSGLAPRAYFDTARRAFERIGIPPRYRPGAGLPALSPEAVERDFIAANPGLATDMIATGCRDGLLTEVRVCLSRNLEPRRCPEVDARGCRAGALRVP